MELWQHRLHLWAEHIARQADDDGIWASTPDSRAALPLADLIGDMQRHRIIRRMVQAGMLKRVARGQYKVIRSQVVLAT